MGHNEKGWGREGKCIRDAAKFCAALLVISVSHGNGKFLHALKYSKGQLSLILVLEVCVFISIECGNNFLCPV